MVTNMCPCCVPAERDALLKLIGSLRREYEAVQMAKNHQEEELKHLKEKMTVGVSDCMTGRYHGSAAANRESSQLMSADKEDTEMQLTLCRFAAEPCSSQQPQQLQPQSDVLLKPLK